eukprot:TRINITY_DN10399_c1_g1_i2.p1 TRINITY_DN10399_c1_g1~~TRINITY_DN10399_c1_g1_i2.p1  ORF type:complete len:200 (+),score=21.95 TRINITY_DN10399_c1_g1_i2:73-672(+)
MSSITAPFRRFSHYIAGGWRWYSNALVTHPMTTKCTSAGVLLGTADIIRQRYEASLHSTPPAAHKGWYSPKRTLILSSWYSMVHAPWVHVWFGALDKFYGSGSTLRLALIKATTDQVISMPIILFGMLFYASYMNSHDYKQALQQAKKNHLETCTGAAMTWMPALTFAFAVIPSRYRLLFINFVQIGFGIFVSKMANKQ